MVAQDEHDILARSKAYQEKMKENKQTQPETVDGTSADDYFEEKRFDREALKKRLIALEQKHSGSIRVLFLRHALRVFPRLGKGDFNYEVLAGHSTHLLSIFCTLRYISTRTGAGAYAAGTYNAIAAAVYDHPAAAAAADDVAYTTAAADVAYAAAAAAAANTAYFGLSAFSNAGYTAAAADIAADAYAAYDNASAAAYTNDILTIEATGETTIESLMGQPLWGRDIPVSFEADYKAWPHRVENLIKQETEKQTDKRIIHALKTIIPHWDEWLKGDMNGATITKYESTGTRITISQNLSDTDHLSRTSLIKGLAAQITHKDNTAPHTIGIFGHWGIGKSNFIDLLNKEIRKNDEDTMVFGEFNAWDYENTDSIHAGITQEVMNALIEEKLSSILDFKFPSLKKNGRIIKFNLKRKLGEIRRDVMIALAGITALYYAWIGQALDTYLIKVGIVGGGATLIFLYGKSFFDLATKLKLDSAAKKLFVKPSYTKYMGNLPDMKKDIQAMCDVRLGKDKKFIFVIEDLDRCSPANIVKTLEAIKLVLNIDRVFVFLLVDETIVLAALAQQYQKLSVHMKHQNPQNTARSYLGKIIQQPIKLGPPDNETLYNFLSVSLWKEESEEDKKKWLNLLPTLETAHLAQKQKSEAIEAPIQQKSKVTRKMPVNKREPDETKKIPSSIEEIIEEIIDNLDMIDTEQEEKAKPQETSNLSLEQKASFAYWLITFDIRNPRQVERMHNSYQQILYTEIGGEKGDKVPNGQYRPVDFIKLKSLCALEFIHNLETENKSALKQEFMTGKFKPQEVKVKFEEIDHKHISDLFSVIHILENEESYDRKKFLQEIETFVLP